jgi:hypothetical protein
VCSDENVYIYDCKHNFNVFFLLIATSAIFLNKIGSGTLSDPKFCQMEEVLVTSVPGAKGSRTPFRLRPSEKELLECCSGTFHHKNTPDYSTACFSF